MFDAVNLNTVAEHRVDYLIELVRVVDSGDDEIKIKMGLYSFLRIGIGIVTSRPHVISKEVFRAEQSTVLVSYSSLDHRLFEGCIGLLSILFGI